MRIFWALGYNQVESFLTEVRPDAIDIDPEATMRRPRGRARRSAATTSTEVLGRAARRNDGSYRAIAGRLLPGKVLGGFKYAGTRPDDPNDIVPHEHRRELRALRVFGAWTNLTDMKAGNTLDTLIDEGGRKVIKHYLQDVGSTFGIGANGPHDWDEGWEYIYDGGGHPSAVPAVRPAAQPVADRRLRRVPVDRPLRGRRSSTRRRGSRACRRPPTCNMRDDDAFWAAQRVMAFSDGMIRAIVKTGQYSDAAAERHLGDVLIKRRDRIGRAYLPRINPIVSPALDASGVLTFDNAAVRHAVASAPRAYKAAWFAFDNETGKSTPLGRVVEPDPASHGAAEPARRSPARSSASISRPTIPNTRAGASPSVRISAGLARAGNWLASRGCHESGVRGQPMTGPGARARVTCLSSACRSGSLPTLISSASRNSPSRSRGD